MTTTRSIRWLLLSLLTAFALLWSPAMAIAQDGLPSEPETTQEGSDDDADEGASGSIDLASPRSAISSFMRAMRAHTGLEPEPRALERALGAVEIPSDVLREADDSEVAFRLYEVLRYFESFAPGEDLASIAPSRNNLPSDGVWTSTLTDADGDTTLLLELEARDGDWRISEGTTRIAYALYDSLELDLVQSTLRRWGLEWAVSGRLFGLRYYQWAGLFVLILLGLCFDLALRGVVQVISRRYLKKSEDDKTEHDTGELIRRVARPAGLAGGATLVYLLLPILQMPVTPTQVLQIAAKAFALVSAIWAIYRVVDLASEYFERKAGRTTTKFDDLLVPLVRKAVKIFVVAFGLVFIAESFDLPITSLVAGLGIGGLAFAFAAKDTIENLFGSVAVILDRPFNVGDWIQVGETEGIVEDLGFRSTRIRTFHNSLVTVPNATLVRATVDNYGRRMYRRYRAVFNLTYDTDPNLVEAYCEGLREIVRSHPHTRKDVYEVHLNNLGAHSIDVLVYIFFRVPDWSTELRERHRFILDALRLAKKLGVEYAFPTQTLHLQRDEESDHRSQDVARSPEEEMRERGRAEAASVLAGSEWQRQDRT
ncbi:MAG: mechanosensitive ion channel family protein [Phycisphaerales bacterium]